MTPDLSKNISEPWNQERKQFHSMLPGQTYKKSTTIDSRRSAVVMKRSRQSEMSSNPSESGSKPNSPRGPVDPDYMTDETFVSGVAWSELKQKAMADDYMEKSSFVKYLTPIQKETLTNLIKR